ncbi:MAG: lipoprotein signal peptidase [Candidatus Cardinium sp.]|nr:lipoprotein signal peptidase [Candidatus Cardinium sp.]
MRQFIKYFIIVLLIVLADQASKLWVHYHMEMGVEGQINLIGKILKLTYTLNPSMAFSIHLGFKYGKLLLTITRIAASCYIFWCVVQAIRQCATPAWVWGWALVLAGAIGNSIDSTFYGIWLDNALDTAPMQWFHGQVIDMIHIDLWSGVMPDWMPIWGGMHVCCLPIFNIADVAISVGLLFILCNASAKSNSASNLRNECALC